MEKKLIKWVFRYLEIEGREVPCTEELLYMDPKKAVEFADENTIGICAILGSTVSNMKRVSIELYFAH